MNLIWHAVNLKEPDWLHDLLGDVITNEFTDLDLERYDSDSIHVVSSVFRPLSDYEKYFSKCRSRSKRNILIHLSDEWLSGGYRNYKYFDMVVKNHWSNLISNNGVMTIPLGYTNGTRIGSVRPADQRRFVWSFAGETKASRADMLSEMNALGPKSVTITKPGKAPGEKLSKTAFDELLEDSVFSPCPMGNVLCETWRLYESIELGCIPLLESRPTLDYHKQLLGPNPIPIFRNWAEARYFCENELQNKVGLLRRQAEIGDWWRDKKSEIQQTLRSVITGPSHKADLERLSRELPNRFGFIHEPLRVIELLRHQSTSSLKQRLARPSGPLKRIARETFNR